MYAIQWRLNSKKERNFHTLLIKRLFICWHPTKFNSLFLLVFWLLQLISVVTDESRQNKTEGQSGLLHLIIGVLSLQKIVFSWVERKFH